MDKLNATSVKEWNFNIKEKLEVSDYQYPDFDKQQNDINLLFLEYAEQNLP
jgi:hypothetical protein